MVGPTGRSVLRQRGLMIGLSVGYGPIAMAPLVSMPFPLLLIEAVKCGLNICLFIIIRYFLEGCVFIG